MGQRAGVFCHNGLGDGINCLVLSNNLHLNGWKVDTYQNSVGSMQNWFPHLPVMPYPKMDELPRILGAYDWFFVVQNDTDEFVLKLIQEGKRRFPERLKVIYLYPSKNIVNEPYYGDCLTNPAVSIAENMRLFCEKILHLPKIANSNGFIPLPGLQFRKYKKRVAIHPTSARITRNWPKEKYVKLALHLKEEGYEPVFIPGTKEKEEWVSAGFEVPVFQTLDLLARYIYESGYLIGNDSGLGHLASALGIPTLTFCRRKTWANMWAPSFQKGVVVTPPSWIPNISGFRLRDRHWKKFISIGMARRAFERLVQTSFN
ncbi:MAG TPA: glycosyltransferase family 9 protein [Chlamydiales bacterium]|nr:glycosyltransferase family 9 protein [Chlamydiales bacterium]